MEPLYQYHGQSEDQGATIGVTSDGKDTPLCVVRLWRIEIPLSGSLNMNENMHLIIGYLLRDDRAKLKVIIL